MSTERTDQYPEVSGEEAGIVPQQGAAKSEWPKKIRTLTAAELDRLTIDEMGRFHWDGKLVVYETTASRLPAQPVDLDQHAMDLLDRTARELSDPNSPTTVETVGAPPTVPELAATPADQLVPTAQPDAPAASVAPVVHTPRAEVIAPSAVRAEGVRVKLTALQSIGLTIVVVGLLAGALGIAASSLVAAHDWACKAGMVKRYCPVPPPAPTPPARPDIPA